MASLAQHIAARNDNDLLARLVAAAEMAGIDNPQGWAETHRGELVAVPVSGDQSIADVHAYAVASYTPTPTPGADASKITDEQIKAAVAKVQGG